MQAPIIHLQKKDYRDKILIILKDKSGTLLMSFIILMWGWLLFAGGCNAGNDISGKKPSGYTFTASPIIPKINYADTTKPICVTLTKQQWINKIDTLNQIVNVIGKSMTVDQSDNFKSAYNAAMANIYSQIK